MSSIREWRCPRCGQVPFGKVPAILMLSMELRSKRQGVEIECRKCGHVYLQKSEPDPIPVFDDEDD